MLDQDFNKKKEGLDFGFERIRRVLLGFRQKINKETECEFSSELGY